MLVPRRIVLVFVWSLPIHPFVEGPMISIVPKGICVSTTPTMNVTPMMETTIVEESV